MNAPNVSVYLLALAALCIPFASPATSQTLSADVTQIDVVGGGTQTLTLDAGPSNASKLYLLLGSASGTAPGVTVDGQLLPLNIDTYLLYTLVSPNVPPLGSSFGILSPNTPGPGGLGTATFSLPPGQGVAYVGLTLDHAAVVLDLFSGTVKVTSNAVPVDLVGYPVPGDMVSISAGTFVMGDHFGVGESNETPLHTVSLDPFYMDVFETTNEAYAAYLNSALAQGLIQVAGGIVYNSGGGGEPYFFTDSASGYSYIVWNGSSFSVESGKLVHPVVEVSWYGAVAYANWRSAQEGLTPCYDLTTWSCNFNANGYRLPTEAEWEYAARGGLQPTYYQYPWGNTIDGSQANYSSSGDPYESGFWPWTTPVGYYDGTQSPAGVDMANGFGLYDTSGNVLEWCNDWYSSSYYGVSPSANPHGPESGSSRVIRGGSWNYGPPFCLRSAFRFYSAPGFSGDSFGFGFRLARVSTQ